MSSSSQKEEEIPMMHVTLGPPCRHKLMMPADKLREEIKKADKAVKRNTATDNNLARILCKNCINRVDKASCSIDPFREIMSITHMLPPGSKS